MAHPNVDAIVGHYSHMFESWLDRWRQIVIAGRGGTYTADLWARDAAATAAELAATVTLAKEYIDPPTDSYIPGLSVTITPGDAEVLGVLAIPAPGAPLVMEPLGATDNPGVQIDAARIQHWVVQGNLLVLRLSGMDQNPPLALLTPGREFTAFLHAQGNQGDRRARLVLTVS